MGPGVAHSSLENQEKSNIWPINDLILREYETFKWLPRPTNMTHHTSQTQLNFMKRALQAKLLSYVQAIKSISTVSTRLGIWSVKCNRCYSIMAKNIQFLSYYILCTCFVKDVCINSQIILYRLSYWELFPYLGLNVSKLFRTNVFKYFMKACTW